MANLMPLPKMRFTNAGRPLVGGKVFFYVAGTTIPKNTFKDRSQATANTNPVILDSNGEADIWLEMGYYKVVLKTSTDVVVWTVDGVAANANGLNIDDLNQAVTDSQAAAGEAASSATDAEESASRVDLGALDQAVTDAQAAADIAAGAVSGSVNTFFAATKAAGDTLAASLADGATVIVTADESQGGVRVRYTVASAALTAGVVDTAVMTQWERTALSKAIVTVNGALDSANVSVWEYAHLAGGYTPAGDPTTWDWTPAINAATAAVAATGGGILHFPQGDYKATRLITRTLVKWRGDGQANTYLLCTDASSTDAGVAFGSFIRKADDGTRALYGGISGMTIATAKSSVSAAQDANPNVIGLNLTACERFKFDDVAIQGFGYAGLVFARAEAGAEGMGFTNTTQDGNYNTVTSLHIISCGKFNPDEAAVWFKYKANSNKIFGLYCKPASLVAVAIPHGNDNLICGGSVESSKSIATFGKVGAVGASGNVVLSMRAEVLSGDAYVFAANSSNNTVLPGYQTGVTGSVAVLTGPNNRVITEHLNYLRVTQFPPVSSVSTLHNHGMAQLTGINGDDSYPLYVKSDQYNDGVRYPVIRLWDSNIALLAGKYIGKLEAENRDGSGGAAGIGGAIGFIAEATGGQTAITLETGTGTTRVERWRVTNAGNFNPFADNSYSIGTAALRAANVFSSQFRPGTGGPIWTSGVGTPEGAVTAPIGSLYTRTDGGAATTLYVKETGAGNTGWVAK